MYVVRPRQAAARVEVVFPVRWGVGDHVGRAQTLPSVGLGDAFHMPALSDERAFGWEGVNPVQHRDTNEPLSEQRKKNQPRHRAKGLADWHARRRPGGQQGDAHQANGHGEAHFFLPPPSRRSRGAIRKTEVLKQKTEVIK